MWCSVVQCVAVCCSVLQCVAVCCSVLQGIQVYSCVHMYEVCAYTCKSTDRHFLECFKIVLQYVAVCCSVLQCVYRSLYVCIYMKRSTRKSGRSGDPKISSLTSSVSGWQHFEAALGSDADRDVNISSFSTVSGTR